MHDRQVPVLLIKSEKTCQITIHDVQYKCRKGCLVTVPSVVTPSSSELNFVNVALILTSFDSLPRVLEKEKGKVLYKPC